MFGQAFGGGGADKVLAQDFEHLRPDQAHQTTRQAQAENDRGNDDVRQIFRRVVEEARIA